MGDHNRIELGSYRTTCFDVSREAGVAEIRMNRPDKLNSMIASFWTEFPEILRDLDEDGGTHVAVLSSTGRHFTAGMDLAVFDDLSPANDDPGRAYLAGIESIAKFQASFSALEQCRFPVIAAVQGGCIGGGLDMITACDMRYATGDAFFQIQETNIGITADVGTLQRLPKLVPDGVARELAYTGRRMSAEEAQGIGLINEVFSDQDEMNDRVRAVAEEIASKSPLAIWGTKSALLHSRDHTVAEGLDQVAAFAAAAITSGDLRESMAARTEGRAPVYPDLARRSAR